MEQGSAIRLAFWMPKGGVGKTTNTVLLSLLAAGRGDPVLAVDLDPEAGLSRDVLGPQLGSVTNHLKSCLESPVPFEPPVISTLIPRVYLLPCPRGERRFFRLFPERSAKLREGLDLIDHAYRFILLDLPNQLDNIAQLGMAAVNHLILPVELTVDCLDRVEMAVDIISEAKAENPLLKILGALPLAEKRVLSAQEQLLFEEFRRAFARHGITLFETTMYRSPSSVALARSNFDAMLLHWTARRRFDALLNEITARIRSVSPSLSQNAKCSPQAEPSRTALAKAA
jgi:cellulose biosynthesis protein BcsQ